jgi:hypothetical protein
MKTIIFFHKYTFAQARITALRQKSGFLPKNLAVSVILGKKTQFLREVCVTLGLAGRNQVFYQKTWLHLRSRVKKPFLRQVCVTYLLSYSACKYGDSL